MRWTRFWFADIPPHVYALLRITFGLLGCISLLLTSDIATFWSPEGLFPPNAPDSWKGWLLATGQSQLIGTALFVGSLAANFAMVVGYRSRLTVPLCFVANVLQAQWNGLPLSAAHQVMRGILFGLMWVDTGVVWSLDAYRRRASAAAVQVWPLRIIQSQIAIVYLSTAFWKLPNEEWRNGTALAQVLNGNVFRRFPVGVPPEAELLTIVGTYSVLAWEIAFPFFLVHPAARRFILTIGVAMHIGMWIFLEIGLFSAVMLAGYGAFLNRDLLAAWAHRIERWRPAHATRRPAAKGVAEPIALVAAADRFTRQ